MIRPRALFLSFAFAGLLGGVSFEVGLVSSRAAQLVALHRDSDRLARDRTQLQRAQAGAEFDLVEIQKQIDALVLSTPHADDDPTLEAAAQSWLWRVRKLRELVAETPELHIPELALLTERDWIYFARMSSLFHFDSQETSLVESAVSELRTRAIENFCSQVKAVVQAFAREHGGQLPRNVSELAPYFLPPVPDAIFERYEMRATGRLADLPGSTVIVAQKFVIDDWRDSRIEIKADDRLRWVPPPEYLQSQVESAEAWFAERHGGSVRPTAEELLPYLRETDADLDLATLKAFLDSPLWKKARSEK